MESPDFTDPTYGIPVFSLYGEVRRPTGQSMGTFDTILIDLQDLGCRIYTFVTTLALRARSRRRARQERLGARPAQPGGPPGRRADPAVRLGKLRRRRAEIPMRHGLTLGELGAWFIDHFKLDVDYRVIEMLEWQPDDGARLRLAARARLDQPEPERRQPQHGARLCRHGDARRHDARARAGAPPARSSCSARPTSRPARSSPRCTRLRRGWLEGCKLREIWFEPTFHKHVGKLCNGVHIHAEGPFYDHIDFKPWRLQALAFKAIRRSLSRLRSVARLPVRI